MKMTSEEILIVKKIALQELLEEFDNAGLKCTPAYNLALARLDSILAKLGIYKA